MKRAWPKLPPKLVQKALSAHMLIGIVFSALLYLVCVTGVVSTFAHELRVWETPDLPKAGSATVEDVENALRTLLEASDQEPGFVKVYLPTDEMHQLKLVTSDNAYSYKSGELTSLSETASWTDFVVAMHRQLNFPSLLGVAIVGLLGVFMLASTLTGFLAHPRVLRDAFVLRLSGSRRLQQADLHNRLSVWTSPFHIIIATTGAVLGLCTLVAVAIAPLDYAGDISAVFRPVYGEAADSRMPGDHRDVGRAYTWFLVEYPYTEPEMITVRHPNTGIQSIEVLARHPSRLIFGDYYYFRGDGIFTGSAHISDGFFGQQLMSSMYRLHFGNFGGSVMKWIYAVLGVFLCIIVASGMNIYFLRREASARAAPRLARMWASVVWGVPAALSLGLAMVQIQPVSAPYLAAQFWLTLSVLAAISACFSKLSFDVILRGLTCGALGVAAVLHITYNYQRLGASPSMITSFVIVAVAMSFLLPKLAKRLG